ncbi:MAG: hypothetical protein ACP5IX_01640 [Patescibacteria group bacterium]
MFAQNLFYYTVSAAIILVAILIFILLIYWLTILRRVARIFDRIDKTVETIKEKIKISAILGLVSQGLKEVVELIREKRKK